MKPCMKINGKNHEINMEKLKMLSCTFIPKQYRRGAMLFAQKITTLMNGLEMENIDFKGMTPEEYVFAACLACAEDYYDAGIHDFLTMDDPNFLDYCVTPLCDKEHLLAIHVTDIIESWCKKNGEFFSNLLCVDKDIRDIISIAGIPYTLDYSAVYKQNRPKILFIPRQPGFLILTCEIKDETSMDSLYEQVCEELEDKKRESEYEFD